MSHESWNELKTKTLKEQVPRLIVAARDSDDPITRKVRRKDIKIVEAILAERGTGMPEYSKEIDALD